MLESEIENYLALKVKQAGGEVRKLRWIGRRHGPDRFIALNGVTLVELKAPGKKPEGGQTREHTRLRKHGVRVAVIDSFDGVDTLLADITQCHL